MLATLKVVKFLFIAMLVSCSSINAQQGQIIVLNGTTTAGKTSTASELKKMLEAQLLEVEVFGIDSFMIWKVLGTLGLVNK